MTWVLGRAAVEGTEMMYLQYVAIFFFNLTGQVREKMTRTADTKTILRIQVQYELHISLMCMSLENVSHRDHVLVLWTWRM
jgi:hypothetical protein